MKGAKLAAMSIVECLVSDDHSLSEYQGRVQAQLNFAVSNSMLKFIKRYPSLIEASISLCKRRGAMFLSEFLFYYYSSEKNFFFYPSIWGWIFFEAMKKWMANSSWKFDISAPE